MTSASLHDAQQLPIGDRLRLRIQAALGEDPAYAADELVELAEEVLLQIAAVGIAHYVKEAPQKEVYNDFLLGLLSEGGHHLNAGPIYRWAANMIKECPKAQTSNFYSYFWDGDPMHQFSELRLCARVNHLSELRNQLMHGFFVFPPEKNIAEAEHLGQLLQELHRDGLLSVPSDLPFLENGHFKGRWEAQSENDWAHYKGETAFGRLVNRILHEKSEAFWQSETEFLSSSASTDAPKELVDFVNTHSKGAIASWVHPEDETGTDVYRTMGQWLTSQPDMVTIAYRMHDLGLSYSGAFVLDRLIQVLNESEKTLPKNKKKTDQVISLRKSTHRKVVILVHGIHRALFSSQHLARMANFFYENNILLVAVGQHFEYLNPFFNANIQLEHRPSVPSSEQRKELLHAYVRFKGPFFDRVEDRSDIELLTEILEKVCVQLEQGQSVVARRFADQESYPIEYVHEIFALLHPWVKATREPFEEDSIDEEFGFPKVMTEVTPIYMILGRRDLKLEYQHKVLSL